MRRMALIGLCLSGFALNTASAADLVRKAPVSPAYNWTGAYVGINAGGGWGNSDSSAPFAGGSFRTSGGLVGGTLGYNWQTGWTVFGVEGDLDWSNIRGSTSCAGTSCSTHNNWLGTLRGRLGYAWNRVMPYVTGGLAGGDISHSITGSGSSHTTKAGWTLGGGLEGALPWPRWTAKVEYLYVDLGHGGFWLGSDAKLTPTWSAPGLMIGSENSSARLARNHTVAVWMEIDRRLKAR